ncbi:hypothetical protein BX600DRAFT_516572 [Xylariales sp. PMI_506]|nr:hypothetical protein BX600DRAFT_516572 [Xylariales sp. PMI_506]
MRCLLVELSVLLAIATPASAYAAGLPLKNVSPRTIPIARPKETSAPSKGLLNFWPFTSSQPEKLIISRPQRSYNDQVVLRFNISTAEHEAAFRKGADQMMLDIWDYTANYTDIRIPKKRIRAFLDLLPDPLKSDHMILIEDVARAVAATYPTTYKGDTKFETALRDRDITQGIEQHGRLPLGLEDLFFQDYQTLDVITNWMRYLDSMFSPRGLVHMFSVGKSYEGRDIPGLRVGIDVDRDVNKPRKTILVTGGFHAREWISISTVNYLAMSFINRYNKDSVATKILEEFDIVFIPLLNPDGYEYTWKVDRLWRKSRQTTPMYLCHGFDLDRSFGYRWDAAEHQREPCSESYGGDEPFQAVEALRLAEWAKNETTKNNVDFVAYIDLHSYSQQVLWPYAFSCGVEVPNLENMEEVAMNIAKHMRLANGESYTVGSACEGAVVNRASSENSTVFPNQRIEAAGGSAIDYFHHDLNARYSYQIKLRDTGSYGFLLPSDDIVPVGEEVFAAMRYFGDYLLGNNGIERSQGAQIQEHQKVLSNDGRTQGFELRRRQKR